MYPGKNNMPEYAFITCGIALKIFLKITLKQLHIKNK
jgi:hypothetical protein